MSPDGIQTIARGNMHRKYGKVPGLFMQTDRQTDRQTHLSHYSAPLLGWGWSEIKQRKK